MSGRVEGLNELTAYDTLDELFQALGEKSTGSLVKKVEYIERDGEQITSLRIKTANSGDDEMEINCWEDLQEGIIEHGGDGATYFDTEQAIFYFGWSEELEHYRVAIADDHMCWQFTLPITRMKD